MTRAELIEWASTIGKYEHTVWAGKDISVRDVKLAVQNACDALEAMLEKLANDA